MADASGGHREDMDDQQREAFAAAVERKKAEAEERSQTGPVRGAPPGEDPASQGIADAAQKIEADSGVQDDFSTRDKSTRHGKVTADKWNQ